MGRMRPSFEVSAKTTTSQKFRLQNSFTSVKVEKGLQIRKTDLYFLLSQSTARTFDHSRNKKIERSYNSVRQ